jgi:mannose-6-phosphate isomerase-like protein (cupin superfamily)
MVVELTPKLFPGGSKMNPNMCGCGRPELQDYGGEPLIVNIDRLTKENPNYRTALWTGRDLQVTLMSIPIRGDIGLEVHPDTDQFLRIESGYAQVLMGYSQDRLDYQEQVDSDYAILVPAGVWHNVINIGQVPLKVYSIYAPPQHPFGTVHRTRQEAERMEG